MKKGVMIRIIFLIFFVVTGTVFAGAGLLLGGAHQALDWTRAKGLPVLNTLGAYDLNLDMNGIKINASNLESFDMVVDKAGGTVIPDAEKFEELKLEITAGDVHIVCGGEDLILSYEGKGELSYETSGDDLKIRLTHKDRIATSGAGTLTITIPESWGSAEGHGIKSAKIEVGAGNLEIADLLVTDKLELQVGAGNAMIERLQVGEMKADLGMGNLEMTLAGSETDYNFDVEAGVGGYTVGSHSSAGLGSETKLENGAKSDIKIECGMGNVNVRFAQ